MRGAAAAPVAAQPLAPLEDAPAGSREHGGERVNASPLARRSRASAASTCSASRGSGPGGRIVRRDVSSEPPAAAAAPPPPARGPPPAATELEGVATAKGEATSSS